MDRLRCTFTNMLRGAPDSNPRAEEYEQLWRDAVEYLKTCRTEDVDRVLDAMEG